MPFIGNKPSAVPLTSADIADGIITSAKIVDGTIVNADINASSAIAISKISGTGTSNQVLRMNTGATALEFATISTGAAAGQVIQVVTATDSTRRSTSSTSFVTASNTLSVSITPSSASNKILVLLTTAVCVTNDNQCTFTIYRDATNLGLSSGGFGGVDSGADGLSDGSGIASVSYLDSPSTTSSITYQVYFKTDRSTSILNSVLAGIASLGSITVMEIKG